MFDWFIAIRGENFLVYFWLLFIIGGFVGRWFMNRVDGSKHFITPSPTQLNVYEIAALREERKGVIHTALFNLWNAGLIEVSGKNQDAEVKITSTNNLAPKNTFEAMIYRFISEQPRNPKEFFNQASFHSQMDAELETIYQKLEKLHLRRFSGQYEKMKKIGHRILWIIMVTGFLKLFFGIIRDRPIGFLVISLIVMFIIGLIALTPVPAHLSTLGKRYLKSLKTYLKTTDKHPSKELDPALKVAALGIAGLAGVAIFVGFQEAFAASAMTPGYSTDVSGGGCGGGCGGGSDGSSGGCGGCGGGGGD